MYWRIWIRYNLTFLNVDSLIFQKKLDAQRMHIYLDLLFICNTFILFKVHEYYTKITKLKILIRTQLLLQKIKIKWTGRDFYNLMLSKCWLKMVWGKVTKKTSKKVALMAAEWRDWISKRGSLHPFPRFYISLKIKRNRDHFDVPSPGHEILSSEPTPATWPGEAIRIRKYTLHFIHSPSQWNWIPSSVRVSFHPTPSFASPPSFDLSRSPSPFLSLSLSLTVLASRLRTEGNQAASQPVRTSVPREQTSPSQIIIIPTTTSNYISVKLICKFLC